MPFHHCFLLVSYFGPILKWRSYCSAIIFPSQKGLEEISANNGVSKGILAGFDAFGRTVGFELRDTIEVVVARGSALNALKGLGKKRITV